MFLRKHGFGLLVEEMDVRSARFGSVVQYLQRVVSIMIATTNMGCAEVAREMDSPPIEHRSLEFKQDTAANVGEVSLHLVDCKLSVHSAHADVVHDIDLPGRCRFILNKEGYAQVVDTNSGPVLLVASSYLLANSRFCDTRVRAIIVRKKDIAISQNEQQIRSCSTGPFDTKMFHVLSGP